MVQIIDSIDPWPGFRHDGGELAGGEKRGIFRGLENQTAGRIGKLQGGEVDFTSVAKSRKWMKMVDFLLMFFVCLPLRATCPNLNCLRTLGI